MAMTEVAEVESARRAQRWDTFIAAFSNLSTAYNLVNINIAHVILENQYCGGDNCKNAVTIAGTACLVGAITGQLSFGYIGDCLGRSCALRLTMVLSIAGALSSAFAVPLDASQPSSVFTFISISRFFLGVGVGGVYPLAATIAAESSDNQSRGRSVSLVFSMQGVGTLLVPVIAMVFLYSFGTYDQRHKAGDANPGIAWRLILGVGALPGLILIFLKTKSTNSQPAAAADSEPGRQTTTTTTLMQALRNRRYWPKIIGCAGGWFIFDITFYGNTLFSPSVLKIVFKQQGGLTPTIGDSLRDNMCLQLTILALIGLPGYYVSVWLMDSVGRKKIQLQGFIAMAVLYAALGIFLSDLEQVPGLLLIIYGLTYFFSNFGPNSTTFILPSETFAFEVRSTLNGLSAASGKIGATLGSACFKPVVNSMGTNIAFYLCAGCSVAGVLVTYFFVEDRVGREMAGASFLSDSPAEANIEAGGQQNKGDAQTI